MSKDRSKFSIRWLKGVSGAENKGEVKRRVLNCVDIWDKLNRIIQEDEEQSIRKMRAESSFDSPAWSEKQAYELGFQAGLDRIKKVIPQP